MGPGPAGVAEARVLGILFLLGIGHGDVIAAVVAVPVGLLAMAVLVVDEADEVFANLYSTGVSLQNAAPRLPGRRLALALGALATGLAALVGDLSRYQSFLFLLGALFVPLFGVLAADYFVLARRRYDVTGMYRPDGRYRGVRWRAVLVWLAGFLVYNWINPGAVGAWVSLNRALFSGLLHLPFPLSARYPWLGASLPAFAVAFRRCSPPRAAPAPHRARRAAERSGTAPPAATPTTAPGKTRVANLAGSTSAPGGGSWGRLLGSAGTNPVAAPGIPAGSSASPIPVGGRHRQRCRLGRHPDGVRYRSHPCCGTVWLWMLLPGSGAGGCPTAWSGGGNKAGPAAAAHQVAVIDG